jgi:hypothetical protein
LGIEGCFVPVWVRFLDTGDAHEAAVAVSASGICTDLPRDVVEKLDGGALNLGFISFTDGRAVFGRGPYTILPPGTCRVDGMPPGIIDFTYGEYLRSEAGRVLNVQTPQGLQRWLSIGGWPGYRGVPAGEFLADSDQVVTAGTYVVDNGEGGIHVPPFRAQFEVRTPHFDWTNRTNITSVRRQEDIHVTWDGGDAEHQYVTISAGRLECRELAAKGSFTVPAYAWRSAISPAADGLVLSVGLVSDWSRLRFEATGLDLAYGSYYVAFSKQIPIVFQ